MKVEELEVFELFHGEPGQTLIKILIENKSKFRTNWTPPGSESILNTALNLLRCSKEGGYRYDFASQSLEFYFGLIQDKIWNDRKGTADYFSYSFVVKFSELHKHIAEAYKELEGNQNIVPILYLSDASKIYYLSLDAI